MKKETKDEVQNFTMLFIAAAVSLWFVTASAIAIFWMIGLI